MEHLELWLWLANGLGPGAAWLPLWERYGNIEEIYADRLCLLREKLITARQSDRLLSAHPEDFAARRRQHEEKGIRLLSWEADAYPAQLRATAAPPVLLYAQGDISCLQNQLLLGMVGTRHPSAYGVEATRVLSDGLTEAGAVLVSGLAEGLDSEAHKAALRHNTPTVAVLGTDLETFFPARNKTLQELIARCGVLLSEYPCGETGIRYKETFVQRNRIIAGLCRGVCVAEARLRSGTMSTVHYALEYGRDVFAVPGSIFSPLSEGTNLLLKEGAKPVSCPQDVLEEYGLHIALKAPEKRPPAKTEDLTGDLKTVYEAFVGGAALDTGQLGQKTGLVAGRLMTALTRLEMRGLIRQQPGRRFEKAI